MTGEGTTRRIDAYDRWPGLAANILQIMSPEVEKMPSFLPPIFVILHPERKKEEKARKHRAVASSGFILRVFWCIGLELGHFELVCKQNRQYDIHHKVAFGEG